MTRTDEGKCNFINAGTHNLSNVLLREQKRTMVHVLRDNCRPGPSSLPENQHVAQIASFSRTKHAEAPRRKSKSRKRRLSAATAILRRIQEEGERPDGLESNPSRGIVHRHSDIERQEDDLHFRRRLWSDIEALFFRAAVLMGVDWRGLPY